MKTGIFVYNKRMYVKSFFLELLAAKSLRESRRISVRLAWRESGVSKRVAYSMANNAMREYPADALVKLCRYFECDVGDLLALADDHGCAVHRRHN